MDASKREVLSAERGFWIGTYATRTAKPRKQGFADNRVTRKNAGQKGIDHEAFSPTGEWGPLRSSQAYPEP